MSPLSVSDMRCMECMRTDLAIEFSDIIHRYGFCEKLWKKRKLEKY